MMKFALVGYPLGHSFSRRYFLEKFKKEKLSADFINIETPDIEAAIKQIKADPSLVAFSVTIPHKESIVPLLDKLSPSAQAIGAVNSVKITQIDNQAPMLTGHNTDYLGFRDSFLPLLPQGQAHNALILGTGGASKAIAYTLNQENIPSIFASRTPKSSQHVSYQDIDLEYFSIIINTTPLGTFPNTTTSPSLNYSQLSSHHYLYDLVYNPNTTTFLQQGINRGAITKNGADMLSIQADYSWKIWLK